MYRDARRKAAKLAFPKPRVSAEDAYKVGDLPGMHA